MNRYLFACPGQRHGQANLQSHHGPALSVAPDLALPTAPEPLYEASDLGEGTAGKLHMVLLTPWSGDKDNILYHFQALANSRNWHPRMPRDSRPSHSRNRADIKYTTRACCTE